MIAALPMYDGPQTREANDRLWAGIRDRLRAAGLAAPGALTRGGDLWAQWLAPDLVLSQCCGLPYRARLHGKVALVGTPDYGLEGCPPGYYRSLLVARADDPREGLAAFAGAPVAVNDPLSQSGWAALWDAAQAAGVRLGPVLLTGGHAASAQAVAEGRADLAALDAASWRLMLRHAAFAPALRIVGWTAPAPGLPLIAAAGADTGATFAAVEAAIAALGAGDREALGLRGLVRIPAGAYLALPVPPVPA